MTRVALDIGEYNDHVCGNEQFVCSGCTLAGCMASMLRRLDIVCSADAINRHLLLKCPRDTTSEFLVCCVQL